MKAKDTVMDKGEMLGCSLISKYPFEDVQDVIEETCEHQAEISFKAGMKHGVWLFAWWKDGVQYVGTSGKTLKEAYKELELS